MSRKENWTWMPHAGHFIVGNHCWFHLNTYVGGYIVSTVGDYYPRSKPNCKESEEIGLGRLYETFVFKARRETNPEAQCCPYTAADWLEIDSLGYNDAQAARKGHMKLCNKWANKGGNP